MKDDSLERALQDCSLHALLIICSKVLTRSGFGDVQILDRRQSRQKSRYGGYELICQTNLGFLPVRMIVKVVRDTVRTRMLDELAGATVRSSADFGLIITPYHLTKKAVKHKESYKNVRIEALEGAALSELLQRYGFGVALSGKADPAFFKSLEESAASFMPYILKHRI
jgi:restriction endonuclease Mrr